MELFPQATKEESRPLHFHFFWKKILGFVRKIQGFICHQLLYLFWKFAGSCYERICLESYLIFLPKHCSFWGLLFLQLAPSHLQDFKIFNLRETLPSCQEFFSLGCPPLFFSICLSNSPALEQPLQWTACRPGNCYQSSEWSTKQSTLFSMEGDDKWQRTLRSTRLA